MSQLTRRTQLLLDEDRYQRLEAEAKSTDRSVASIIREGIDLRLGAADRVKRRADAARRLLAQPAPRGDREPDWGQVRHELYDARWRRLYGDDA